MSLTDCGSLHSGAPRARIIELGLFESSRIKTCGARLENVFMPTKGRKLHVRLLRYAMAMSLSLSVGCGPKVQSPQASRPPINATSKLTKGNAELPPDNSQQEPLSLDFPVFVDVHEQSGFEFRFDSGANGRALMFESTGGGGGWIDFDRDGQFDFYCLQGGNPTPNPGEESLTSRNRLLRNQSGQFSETALPAFVADSGYGQGLAVGDFDNDGFQDIYVTNVGPNVLFLNQGDGTFTNVTSAASVGDPNWGSSAAWGDLDEDGDVDFEDFLNLSSNFGLSNRDRSSGDVNGDGEVTFADFLLLSGNFGKTGPKGIVRP